MEHENNKKNVFFDFCHDGKMKKSLDFNLAGKIVN